MAQCVNNEGPMKRTNVSGLVQVAGIMLLPSRGCGNESMIVWWVQSALCKKDRTLLMARSDIGHAAASLALSYQRLWIMPKCLMCKRGPILRTDDCAGDDGHPTSVQVH